MIVLTDTSQSLNWAHQLLKCRLFFPAVSISGTVKLCVSASVPVQFIMRSLEGRSVAELRIIINLPLLVDPMSADMCVEDGNKRHCFGFVLIKGKFVPGEQSRNCPRQVCVIFKCGTDGFWDKFLFHLIEVDYLFFSIVI